MKKILLVFILLLNFTLISCKSNSYHILIDNDAKNFFTTEFLDENRVKGIYYKNEEGKYDYCEEGPKYILIVVDNKETLNDITNNYNKEIDFEKKVVLIYIFSDIYPSRDYYYRASNLTDNKLYIDIKIKSAKRGVGDASAPYQRVLFITLDKIDGLEYEVKIV